MDTIYAATVSLSESRTGGSVNVALLCRDCNGKRCTAKTRFTVPALDVPGTPLEWLIASLGALSETAAEFDWEYEHDAQCEGADQ